MIGDGRRRRQPGVGAAAAQMRQMRAEGGAGERDAAGKLVHCHPNPNSLRDRRLFWQGPEMPKRKNRTAAEQAERFRSAAQKRIDAGMLSVADADDAVDAMIAKNIKDHGA
jgi:hypothetical protein